MADLHAAALSTSDQVVCAAAARVFATFRAEGLVAIVATTRIESKRRSVCASP